MHFRDIPQFPTAHYAVNVDLKYLREHLNDWDRPDMGSPLVLNPDWQRGHVWTKKQKIAYMEYFMKGGGAGREVTFNCSSWQGNYNTPVYCVDGLQRITAALDFLNNKIKVFGLYFDEYEGRPIQTFMFRMLKLNNKRDLLKVYIDFNSGGTPHKPKEIERVRQMLEESGINEKI